MVEFCLDKAPYPCLGMSLSDNKGDIEFINLQTKGRNVSKSQMEWTYVNGVLRPLLYNQTYVGVNNEDYLVLKYKGPPVLFVNEPRFRSNDGKCVTPMKCNRNALGFCSKTSTERATHLARGAYVKLLPCLKISPEWTVRTTLAPTTEYEEPNSTIITPTSSPSSSLFPSSSPSASPFGATSSDFPTVSPSASPLLSLSPSSSPAIYFNVPTSSPVVSVFPLVTTPSPTSFDNQTVVALIASSSYVGLVAIVIVAAILWVIYVNCRRRFRLN